MNHIFSIPFRYSSSSSFPFSHVQPFNHWFFHKICLSLIFILSYFSSSISSSPTSKNLTSKRPNILLFLTDDQDVMLGSLDFMPKLKTYLSSEGVVFENGFTTTPMCCPSRSSILTGLYAHNHHVLTNSANCSSESWRRNHESRTFATYLSDSGYRTGYFGKYLNKYDGHHIPKGWDYWLGLIRNTRFYNYTVNLNGHKIRHGSDYYKDYFPDLITNHSLAYFAESKKEWPQTPVLMVLSYPGPHGPEDSAPQYKDLFFNVTTHHTPAYDYAPNPDKQWILQVTDRMEPIQKKFTDTLMTKRLQTLQSVDAAIEKTIKTLEALGELENTYVFYTSDHGYHLGQFGLVKGKAFPFDVDVKVPFVVRGPGLSKGSLLSNPVLLIDLAPTFLNLAGLKTPPHMDGEPIFKNSRKHDLFSVRQSFLIERGKMTKDIYDKIMDPVLQTGISSGLSGSSSSSISLRQERLFTLCQNPRYQSPCELLQEKRCVVKENGVMALELCSHQSSFSSLHSTLQEKCKPCFKVKRSLSSNEIIREISQEQILEMNEIIDNIAEDLRHFLKKASRQNESFSGDKSNCRVVTHHGVGRRKLSVFCDSNTSPISSKKTINEQIKRYRAQIFELKEIRKHLKRKMAKFSEKRTSRKSLVVLRENDKKTKKIHEDEIHEDEEKYEDEEKEEKYDNNEENCECDAKTLRNLRKLQKNEWKGEKKVKLNKEIKDQKKTPISTKRAKRKKRIQGNFQQAQNWKKNCPLNDSQINCFLHDVHHWKTEPLWTDEAFCACTNSNTNTYSCVRTINSTHNYLYCEFVSGVHLYNDLNVDPHQLRNIVTSLSDEEMTAMKCQLNALKAVGGNEKKSSGVSWNEKYGQFLPPVEEYYRQRN